MANVQDILSTIQNAVDKLSNAAAAKQSPLYRELVNMLQKLQTRDGALLNNIQNLKIINQIKVRLERLIVDKDYKDELKDFAKAYDKISVLQNEYFAQFAATFTPKKTLNILKTSAIETTISNLTETGIEAGVTDGLRQILMRNIQQGGSLADMSEQLRNYMLTNDTGEGALEKYVKTYSTTAINQYSAEYNKSIADDLGLEWYVYVGSLLTTSRPFCVHAVDQKFIHASEFEELLKGHFRDGEHVPLTRKTGLPEGFMEGTNVDNFPRRRAGFNCGHQLIAVDESIVPIDVRNAVYSNSRYISWALKNHKKIKLPLSTVD